MIDACPRAKVSAGSAVRSRRASSSRPDAAAAVAEIRAGVEQPDCKLVVLFVSSRFDLAATAAAIRASFSCPVLACTTAGEIGPLGLGSSSMTAVSLAGGIDAELHAIDLAAETEGVCVATAAIGVRAAEEPLRHSWCLVLHDGLAGREEHLNASLQDALVGTRLIGGSAGDDLGFRASHVYVDGEFRTGHAAVLHVISDARLEPIKIQHFAPGPRTLVVTAADPGARRIDELDGLPAVEVYAQQIGVPVADLTPAVFAHFPFVVEVDGGVYVRSIRGVGERGSLSLYCAIEEGLLCTIGRALDPVRAAEDAFAALVATAGPPEVVIGFDCILRGLEACSNGFADRLYDVYRRHGVVGFLTYGETFGRLHVNQTFTGLAIAGGS